MQKSYKYYILPSTTNLFQVPQIMQLCFSKCFQVHQLQLATSKGVLYLEIRHSRSFEEATYIWREGCYIHFQVWWNHHHADKKQYDGYLQYWSSSYEEIVKSYCGSIFIGHCSHKDLFNITMSLKMPRSWIRLSLYIWEWMVQM